MASHTFAASGTSASLANGAGRQRKRRVAAYGTFGGGTVTFEIGINGTTNWVPEGNISWTAAGVAYVTLFEQDHIRAKLAGATSPSITVTVDE